MCVFLSMHDLNKNRDRHPCFLNNEPFFSKRVRSLDLTPFEKKARYLKNMGDGL